MAKGKIALFGLLLWGVFSSIAALQGRWAGFAIGLIIMIGCGLFYLKARSAGKV